MTELQTPKCVFALIIGNNRVLASAADFLTVVGGYDNMLLAQQHRAQKMAAAEYCNKQLDKDVIKAFESSNICTAWEPFFNQLLHVRGHKLVTINVGYDGIDYGERP